jgi:aminoglycoside 3-N-acetyltransferase
MYNQGIALVREFGDSTISVVEQKAAADAYHQYLIKDPHYFADFRGGVFLKDKTFRINGEMVAM